MKKATDLPKSIISERSQGSESIPAAPAGYATASGVQVRTEPIDIPIAVSLWNLLIYRIKLSGKISLKLFFSSKVIFSSTIKFLSTL